jgi:ABC-type multidrug transport system permease subunit
MSSALIMILSALGGSMFPIFGMPPILQTISKLTLNNWALKGYLSLMMNGTDLLTPIIVLCGMGIAFLTLGITRLKLD